MSSWFYVREGQRCGPVSEADLRALAAEGEVDGATLVWRTGLSGWVRAGEAAGLSLPSAEPPPLPPPLPGGVPVAVAGSGGAGVPAAALAGFGVRAVAKLVDFVLLLAAGRVVEWAVLRWVFAGVAPLPPDWAEVLRMLLWLVAINTVIGMAFTVFFLTRYEATPGKLLLGLRVVRADGSRLGAGRALGRFWGEQVTGLTFFAGYVMAAFDEERRALHDFMCETRVLRDKRARRD
jgi:uncharacterized RDD family membrane protein YckC